MQNWAGAASERCKRPVKPISMSEYNGLLSLEPRDLIFRNVQLKQVRRMFSFHQCYDVI